MSILSFQHAKLSDGRSLSFELGPGEAAWLLHRNPNDLTFGDWSLGLDTPESGTVQFGDRKWEDRGIRRAEKARAEIGRVYEEPRWVNNLNISENTTLALRYHRGTSVPDAEQHATDLCKTMGIDFIRERPARVPEADKMLAQYARALMLNPRLLIVEFPFSRLSTRSIPDSLWSVVDDHQLRGMAVLWLSARDDFLASLPLKVDKILTLS